jgi:tRNA pseudouridine38-40 synthase
MPVFTYLHRIFHPLADEGLDIRTEIYKKLRYFLDISYKGTDFHGWQKQRNATTVQEVLETKLSQLLKVETHLMGSGRTDTGVHAKQQMVHFDHEALLTEEVVYKLNKMLPMDIAAHHLYLVADNAHARFDAISRSYEYHIHRLKNPFVNGQSYYFPAPLSIAALNEASQYLRGKQDFTSFSKVHTTVSHFECDVMEAYWEEHAEGLVFHVRANRFLRGMVRALVGTLIEVGVGRQDPTWIKAILDAKDRKEAGRAVPSDGLFLTRVEYPASVHGEKIV